MCCEIIENQTNSIYRVVFSDFVQKLAKIFFFCMNWKRNRINAIKHKTTYAIGAEMRGYLFHLKFLKRPEPFGI
jgi:hypothetical protein